MKERKIICFNCGCTIQEATPVRLGGLMLPSVPGECLDCREARESDEREDAEEAMKPEPEQPEPK